MIVIINFPSYIAKLFDYQKDEAMKPDAAAFTVHLSGARALAAGA